MSELLPIINSIKSSSSGTGVSHYSTAARCPRRARLDKELRDIKSQFEDTSKMDAGTLFHALMAIWYGEKKVARVELDDVNLDPVIKRAEKMFSEYTRHFQPDEWGEVYMVEQQFPQNDFHKTKMEEAIGISPFTMRIDLVVRMTEQDVERVERNRPGLVLDGPGIYMVDHKTSGAKSALDALEYRFDTQGLAYQMAWNAMFPDDPCHGMIFNKVIDHKAMERFDKNGAPHSFQTFLCPAPTYMDTQAIRSFFKYAKAQSMLDSPNHTACFDFNRQCPYLVGGLCDRS